MAINDNQKPSRSKHRRNSDDETEETSKRHKHRHHHRRHRSKKQEDREINENTDIENAPPAVVVSNGDYDMEEGEMVDDDCQIGGYTNNHSDQITVGVEAAVDSDRVVVIVEEKVGNPTDLGKGETSVFTEMCCDGGIDLNSIIEDVTLLHKQTTTTTTHSDGHETMSIHQLDNQHGGRHSLREKKREHSSSYYSRHNIHTNDSSFRDKSCEGNRDRNIERERARGKEMERERERDRERRRGRRDREGNRDIVYRKHHDADNIGDRERHSDRRHQRWDDKDYRDRARDIEKELIHTHKTDNSETNTEELHRDEDDEQEDYKETAVLQFAEQEEEEEDLKRIKEESRRRRQAILEIYKSQQSQQKHEQKSEEGSAKQPSITVAETHNGQNESAVMFLNETSFSLGKSPEQTEPPALKSSGTRALGEGTPKSERSDDMVCDTIFGASSPAAGVRKQGKGDGFKIERSGLPDNWDDAEGYYCYRLGEVLGGRYEVIRFNGKGMYSNVVRARDLKAGYGNPEEVAIKILRNNDTIYKAGLQERVILKKLIGADVEDRRHCVRLLSSFDYRNHLCLVFESLHMNLREVLNESGRKKSGRKIGLKLTAVRAYATQCFIALKHLKNCGVLHSDIKPDNMLVNKAKNVLKLCDYGTAMFAEKNEITPLLVSRFYRPPEIILGLTYGHPMDIWSVGCCLYELYTGKVLFKGLSNNDMLRLHMELKGPFPKKMLRKGAFTDQHFDQDMNFLATEVNPVTKKPLTLNIKPKDGDDRKMLANFKNILEKIFVLDPDKRITVSQALSHPFITDKSSLKSLRRMKKAH